MIFVDIQFYDVKSRQKVSVPESDVKRTKYQRETSKGMQTRYALRGTYNGSKLTKFVSQADWEKINAPEE